MTRLRIVPWFALVCALCWLPALSAQVSTIAPRLTGPVDESSLTTMKGSLTILAQPKYDRGEADPGTVLHNVRLVVHRSPQQEAALEQFMAGQIDRNSPNYHHWLTPAQFDRLYGLADSDSAAIVAWLQSHGLTLGRVSGTDISFSGSVAQVEEALHTSIHSFVLPDGRQFLSNITDPRIPSAFSQVISGVAFLNTLQPRSHAVRGPSGKYDPALHRMVPTSSSDGKPRPDLTVGTPPQQFLYLVPADAATIYDTPNSFNANFSTGTAYDGSGVTIGIGGDGAIQSSTVVDYRTRFMNGDTTAPNIVDVGAASGHPAQANGDTDEAYLDTELAGGLAPKAKIDFYVSDRDTTNGIFDAVPQMITDNNVDIISLSFGECELDIPTTYNMQISQWWQEAAADGIAVVVSTGDNGTAGCDDQNSEYAANSGLNVSGLSTTPYNIAVGGTDFYGLLAGNFSTYANSNETATNNYGSALMYIPESPWNDSSSTFPPASYTANVEAVGVIKPAETNIVAATGGESTCSTNTTTYNSTTGTTTLGTCTSGYPQPTWQRGAGVPNHGHRDVPDVSLLAANGYYGATWAVCVDDIDQTNNNPENCTTQGGIFEWAGVGGTSASTPAFAGILAMLTQKAGGRIGMEGAKFLYDLYNSNPGVFNDVTVGNNSVVCVSGTTDCTQVSAGNDFLSGYDAGVGYDLATGLGSVDASKLIAAYGSSTGTAKATVTAVPTPSSVTTAQSVQLAVTVTGASGTPTGTVTVSGDGYTSAAESLVAGAVTFNIPPGALLAANNATLTVTYSGDSNYAQATGTAQVTVTAVVSKLTPTVTVLPASNTVATAQSLNVTVTVDGGNGNPTPTGNIVLTAGSFTSSATSLNSGSITITIPANSFTFPSSGTISAQYSGDPNYNTATGSVNETLTLSTFTVAASAPTALSHSSGATSTTSTVTVSAVSSYAGSITLACALTGSPSGASDLPSCAFTAGNPVTLTATSTTATATATVNITQATSSLDRRGLPGWLGTGGGTALALLVFFGIPARRRGWRNLVGMLVILGVLGTLSACGGGGGGTTGGGNSGTTPGNYTFTVTGTGNPSTGTSVTTTFTVTVN